VVTTSLERRQEGDVVLRWLRRWRGRDDQHLVKPGPLEPVDPLEELIRLVNEAQGRDARDERRLYDPKLDDRPFFSQRSRPE
jgi:hypothetical protein